MMLFNVVFKVYKREDVQEASEICNATFKLEKQTLLIRILNGDPYYAYHCVRESSLEEAIPNKRRYIQKQLRKGIEIAPKIVTYISGTPDLFLREPLDNAHLPPKYRFSGCSRMISPEGGAPQRYSSWGGEEEQEDDLYALTLNGDV